MSKVWFITGSSRGLGRSLTTAVLAAGHRVAATARNLAALNDLISAYPGQILPIALDVTSHQQIQSAVALTISTFGQIDVLVNNAGFGIIGATEAFSDEQVDSQLQTNLYAPIAITRAVLPHMRKQRSGRILQISSIGGRIGNPGISIYQAAKFGLSGFTESLAKEVRPLNIFVTSVEPGGFRTDWAGASMTYAPVVPGYETTVGWMTEVMTGGKFVPMGDPDKAAKAMLELADAPQPPIHLVLGSEAVGMLKQANAARDEELNQWLAVSLSTDHDEAVNYFAGEEGKKLH